MTCVLSGTTISATNISASTFSGSGASLPSLNASNVNAGTLLVSRGGTLKVTSTANQLFKGKGTSALLRNRNLTWSNITNTLSATNFVGSGSQNLVLV